MKLFAEAEDKELDKLKINLADALAEEAKIIININKLENCLKSEQFNEIIDMNKSVTRGRAIAHVYDAPNTKNFSSRSEFLEHISDKHVPELDTMLSGVEFKVQQVHSALNGIQYKFSIASGKVEFFLHFLWCEQSNSVKHVKVEFPLARHRVELAPSIRTLERQKNVHKIIRMVTEYSNKCDHREKILRELVQKYGSILKYTTSENEGYDFGIFDQSTGKKYFEANWMISLFKDVNKMDHCFSFNIHKEAEALSEAQKEIFKTLTRGSDHSGDHLNVRRLIEHLVRGFSNWLQE